MKQMDSYFFIVRSWLQIADLHDSLLPRRRPKVDSRQPAGRVHGQELTVDSIQSESTASRKSLRPCFLAPRPSTFDPRLLSPASAGFSLVEVVIAIGVAAFCLVAMLGLIPTGLKSVKTSTQQTAAASLLDSVALDLRSTPLGSNSSPSYGITLPTWGSTGATNFTNFYFNQDGTTTNTNTSVNAYYGVNLTLSNATPYLSTATLQIYWPAAAPSIANAQGVVETVISIIRQ